MDELYRCNYRKKDKNSPKRRFYSSKTNLSRWYLPSSSLCWASRLRLLLLSWECLSSSSSSSASCRCCSAVILSWSRLSASILASDSSRSRAHTLDSAARAAQRASLSLQRASTAACWEVSDACSTCVCVCVGVFHVRCEIADFSTLENIYNIMTISLSGLMVVEQLERIVTE